MKKVLFLFSMTTALLAANLDDLMPLDIQKKTGVDTLSPAQKQALADWLSTKQSPKKQAEQQQTNQTELYLSENIQGGKILKLSDNTTWEVDPQDVTITRIWLYPFPVKIEIDQEAHPRYPYKLTNLRTGTSVNVQKL